MVTVRRTTLAVVGGMSTPVLLFFAALAADDLALRWLADALLFAVAWPLAIYDPIFPPAPHCWACGPTTAATLISMLCDFTVYALLSYAFLSWRSIADTDEDAFQTLNLSSPAGGSRDALPPGAAKRLGAAVRRRTAAASFTDEDRIDAQTFAEHPRAVR